MKERIQKVLARAGVAARRKVEEMVLAGRISVNGNIRTNLPVLIDPETDRIKVDDEPVRLATPHHRAVKPLYILLNKPSGVFSTNVSQGEQTRAIDLLPPGLPSRVYPVGQLDAESKGLLLLTNDGDLTNLLTHPRYGVPKTYRAVVDGFVNEQTQAALEQGVWLADEKKGKGFKTGRCQIKIIKRLREKSVLELTLREGRNRQVRRMLARMGHRVRELTRVRIGPLTLDGLSLGQSRLLTSSEIRQLKNWKTRPAKGGKITPSDPAPAT